jgi:hypothetical protein
MGWQYHEGNSADSSNTSKRDQFNHAKLNHAKLIDEPQIPDLMPTSQPKH